MSLSGQPIMLNKITLPGNTASIKAGDFFLVISAGRIGMINKVEIVVSILQITRSQKRGNATSFKQMQAGDKSAQEKLVNSNLRLVLSVIQRFNNRHEVCG